jgi:hypothetical protein
MYARKMVIHMFLSISSDMLQSLDHEVATVLKAPSAMK